jgi:ferredoxin-type protein NapF
MSAVITRRSLLRGELRTLSVPIRPPWALDEDSFLESCTRCGECLNRCPQQIITAGSGGFPVVDFSRGGCSFCAECVSVCEPGALSSTLHHIAEAHPWSVKASLNRSCFNYHGVFCRVCADRCIARAIRFRPVRGGAFLPLVDQGACSGCGACIAGCPAGALRVERVPGTPNQAETPEESPA